MKDEIRIEGEIYIKKSSVELSVKDGLRYAIVRCKDAGVHAGYIKEHKSGTREVILVNSRRLWRWWGKTLSGLATEGTFAPEKCKFSDPQNEILVSDMCEINYCTCVARKSIQGVSTWKND